jgi:hypothetical protein
MLSLFALILFFLGLHTVNACSCLPPAEFPSCTSEIVLYGEAVENTPTLCPDDQPDSPLESLADFKIITVLKQPGSSFKEGQLVKIASYISDATCGYQLSVGTKYVLFPERSIAERCKELQTSDGLTTSLCAGNIMSPSQNDVNLLAKTCSPTSQPEETPKESPKDTPKKPLGPRARSCQKGCRARCEKFCKTTY